MGADDRATRLQGGWVHRPCRVGGALLGEVARAVRLPSGGQQGIMGHRQGNVQDMHVLDECAGHHGPQADVGCDSILVISPMSA